MKKLRSDARWHTFTPEQQKKIQHWLFEEHFSYQKTRELMNTELGLVCALSTIGTLYSYLEELRAADVCGHMMELAAQTDPAGEQLEKLRAASKLLIATKLMEKCLERGSAHEIAKLGRLMLHTEDQEIQRGRTELVLGRFLPVAAHAPAAANHVPRALAQAIPLK